MKYEPSFALRGTARVLQRPSPPLRANLRQERSRLRTFLVAFFFVRFLCISTCTRYPVISWVYEKSNNFSYWNQNIYKQNVAVVFIGNVHKLSKIHSGESLSRVAFMHIFIIPKYEFFIPKYEL